MGKKHASTVSVIEAAYAPAETDEDWLGGLIDTAQPIVDEGLGLAAYVYDASGAQMKIHALVERGIPFPTAALTGPITTVDEDYIARTWRVLSFALASEVMPFSKLPAAKPLIDIGCHDMLAVNAYEPSGGGVWLGAPLPAQRTRRTNEERTWTRVASHIASAFRLRRASALSAIDRAAAVLRPDGKVDHAEDDANDKETLDGIQEAVRRMERARGPLRKKDPLSALELWRTLVDSRFTLVDHFEKGGRRYIVAVENSPMAPGPEVLSARERQVLAAAAAGRSNKLIAYELGLSDSTVRVLLARAAKKLSVQTREELVALQLAHARAQRRPDA